jgi:hypothetical protein
MPNPSMPCSPCLTLLRSLGGPAERCQFSHIRVFRKKLFNSISLRFVVTIVMAWDISLSVPLETFSWPLTGISLGPPQARTGRGIHGLPKVSPSPVKPNPYTPCGQSTPQTALRPFEGWPACRAGGLRPSSSPLDIPSRTGLVLLIADPS